MRLNVYRTNLIKLLVKTGQEEEAGKIISAAYPAPQTAVEFDRRAQLYEVAGQSDKALADFERALRLFDEESDSSPSSNLYSAMIGLLISSPLADRPRAIEVAQEAVQKFPENHEVWFTLGQAQTEPTDKIAAFRRAMEIQPTRADVMILLSDLLLSQNQGDEGIALFERGIDVGRESGTLTARFRTVHAGFLSRLDDAEQRLTAAIERYPEQSSYYRFRAVGLQEQGKHEEALADYGKAIELDPQFRNVSFYGVYVDQVSAIRHLCAAGRKDEAVKHVRAYLEWLESLPAEAVSQLSRKERNGSYRKVMSRLRFMLAELLKTNGQEAEGDTLWKQALEELPDAFLDYKIRVVIPGTYRLYVRWDGETSRDNTFFARIVGLSDGPDASAADWYWYRRWGNDSDFATGSWQGSASFEGWWGHRFADEPAVWSIPKPGEYTIRLSHCKTGAALDAFVFQRADLPALENEGPPENGRTEAKVFLESDGRFVVEAENFSSRGAGVEDQRSWKLTPQEDPGETSQRNFRGTGYVQFGPESEGATGGFGHAPTSSEYQSRQAVKRYSRYIDTTPDADWYAARALAYVELKEFTDAIGDYTKAVSLKPDEAGYWLGRGRLYAQQGQFDKALADLERAVELRPDYYFSRYQHALTALGANDRSAYRELCARILEVFQDSKKVREVHFASWACVLAPSAIDDYTTALTLARRALEIEPEDMEYQNGLGAVQMRAGRYTDALASFTKAAAGEESRRTSRAYTLYFQAMTEQHLDQKEAARQTLARANEQAEKESNDANSPPPWNRKLTLELLRNEAETLHGVPEDAAKTKTPAAGR